MSPRFPSETVGGTGRIEHMSECGFQAVPAEVDDLPAGAALAAVLERIDPAAVSAHDTMRVLSAHRRQLAHQQASFSASVLHAALADPSVPGHRCDSVGVHGADEARMVLHESRSAVHTMLCRAEFADAWPVVGHAWRRGDIDRERVRICETWTEALSLDHRAAVLEIVVPEAGGLTLKGLMDRIEQLARDLDPEWARTRYEEHKRQRRVRARRTESGTVNVSGLDLGLDDGALALRHVAVLAKRARALGHPGLIDTVEADLYVALLKPRPADWSDDDLVAAVVAAARPDDPRDPSPAAEPAHAPTEPAPRPDGSDPTTADYPADYPDGEPDAGEPDAGEPGSEESNAGGPDAGGPDGDGSGTDDPVGMAPTRQRPGDGSAEVGPAGTRGLRWPRRAKLGLRVGLYTLLGLDDHTARMPGYGVIHAHLAGRLTRDWTDAEWRLALQDDTGALSTVLITSKRPLGWATVPINPDGTPVGSRSYHPATGHPAASPAPPRELIVIHATEEQLAGLNVADHPAWAELITDARRQTTYWHRDAARRAATGAPSDDLGVRLRGHHDLRGLLDALTGSPLRDPSGDPSGAPTTDLVCDPTGDAGADPTARFPSAAQRRWVSERDRTCIFPGCGADAVHTDIDHTRPHHAGGPTLSWNLGPACTHDNLLKEQPGWSVDQTRPGHYRWHSNTGHTYPASRTGPVPDHPAPRRFRWPSSTTPAEYAGDDGAWVNEPYPIDPAEVRRIRERLRAFLEPAGTATPRPERPPPDDDPPPF